MKYRLDILIIGYINTNKIYEHGILIYINDYIGSALDLKICKHCENYYKDQTCDCFFLKNIK